MPLQKVVLKPGINRNTTNYAGEGGYWDCDKIRFRAGYPEKIGGWVKYTPNTFIGTCRQMWNWVTTFSDNFLALGTNAKAYIEVGEVFNDITPIRQTITSPTTNNSVSTTNGSTTVTFAVASHGAATGDYVTISGCTAVGGIAGSAIDGNRKVTVVDSSTFTIVADTAATSTASSGGGTSITLAFEVHVGYASMTRGYGWGAGTWSRNQWGLGSTTTPVWLEQQDWWLDNFDNDLVLNIRDGGIYYWQRGSLTDPTTALATRAVLLSSLAGAASVPVAAMQVMVSQQDKHLIAFGCVPYGSSSTADFDPMLIRWSNQDDPVNWAPAVTNSAGFLRVSRGSQIVRALPSRQETLVWTDTSLYSLQFLGTTDVYGLQEYADNISIMSPRACTNAAGITYWMGKDKFYAYAGRVETVPCTVRDYIFKDINYVQNDQVICGTNDGWNEVWWFYPSASSNWNDRYVVFNYIEQVWYYGTMERTAWLDTPLRTYPQAATTNENAESGYMYDHESGVDADGSAMTAYVQSSDFDVGDGDKFMLTRRILTDFSFTGSTASTPQVTLQVRPRNFPGSAYQSDAADSQNVTESSVGVYTDQVFIRARARQMALKVLSNTTGVQWQLGALRVDARIDGSR